MGSIMGFYGNQAVIHIGSWQLGLMLIAGGLIVLLLIILAGVLYRKSSSEKSRLKSLVDERTEALERETAILRTVFDSIPAILFCKDMEHRLLHVNTTFEQMFDIPREQLIGRTELDALNVPEEEIYEWREMDSRIIAEQKAHVFEEDITVDGKGVRNHETTKVPLIHDGEVIGLLGMSRDITERKLMEKEIVEASSAKTTFIANMSHEIRTPMNSIVGFSELALEEAMSPKAKTYLERIMESSNWLLQIINDILDISKIETGKLEVENIPFDLADIFASCQAMAYPSASEKGIRLHFYAESLPDDKLLLGDPLRLRQVFTNLVTNAIKFTSEGTVRILSKIVESTDSACTIYFEIQDTGIGMTPEQIKRIAEPFMQADVSITREYGGTGLGVPIVSRLVELMGGELKIESWLGEGSSFSFQITMGTIDAPEVRAKEINPLIDQRKPMFKGQVLVCEDTEMNQMVISGHLSRVGLTAIIAENGQIGVNMVKKRMNDPFDLIFMDIHMPVMDGLDATRRIQELGCTTPIVALTANIMASDREAYKQYGMADCIGKPFTSLELWNCLLKYIKQVNPREADAGESEASYNKNLLLKLNESFVRDNRGKFKEIMSGVEDGDMQRVHRLVHTLKSSAGLIDEKKLQLVAAETESLLRDNMPISNERWSLLERELRTVLNKLAYVLEEAPERSGTVKRPKEVVELFMRLEPLLIKRSPECLDFIDEILAVSGAEELARHIQAYDFRPAMLTLSQLKERWRIE